ncbi:OprD family outer membrane porin [Marinobacterium sp. YM272]|uniref:OprD family outer membrane porin n=1 Tax=Marinobacterium sp. YM272 TaxID=3421654 RepID=UPI003D7F733C
MKLRHDILLAAAIAASTTANVQADSFREALTGGKVSGEIRNTYAGSSYSDAKPEAGALNNANVLGSALDLNYETGSFNGFKAVVGFQAGRDWGIQDEDSGLTVAGGEDDARVTIDATDLRLAYLEYAFNKEMTATSVRIGRQKIVSPLLMNSGAFPMQDSFDALVIDNRDLPDTTLKLMVVDRWNMRYGDDSNGGITQEDKQYDDLIYSLYLSNNSFTGLNIEAQWLSNDNDDPAGDPPAAAVTADPYDTGFLGLTYKVPNSSWVLGAKAMTADYENRDDTGYWGVKAQTQIKGVEVQLGYTSVQDDGNFPGSLGHVPMFRSYKSGFIDEIFAGLDTTSLRVSYGFGVPGLKADLVYSGWKQSDAGIAASGKDLDGGYEAGIDIRYKFQTVEGLSARVKSSYMDFDREAVGNDDLFTTRVSVNYRF